MEALLQQGTLGPTPRVSDSLGLGWGLRICIPNKRPGDAACLRDCTLRTTLLSSSLTLFWLKETSNSLGGHWLFRSVHWILHPTMLKLCCEHKYVLSSCLVPADRPFVHKTTDELRVILLFPLCMLVEDTYVFSCEPLAATLCHYRPTGPTASQLPINKLQVCILQAV